MWRWQQGCGLIRIGSDNSWLARSVEVGLEQRLGHIRGSTLTAILVISMDDRRMRGDEILNRRKQGQVKGLLPHLNSPRCNILASKKAT